MLLEYGITSFRSIPSPSLSFPHVSSFLMTRYLNLFLLGVYEEIRKIPWMKWDMICLEKENGGYEARKIREFNLSLLENRCLGLNEKHDCLWFKFLAVIYGIDGGRVREGGWLGSAWLN